MLGILANIMELISLRCHVLTIIYYLFFVSDSVTHIVTKFETREKVCQYLGRYA